MRNFPDFIQWYTSKHVRVHQLFMDPIHGKGVADFVSSTISAIETIKEDIHRLTFISNALLVGEGYNAGILVALAVLLCNLVELDCSGWPQMPFSALQAFESDRKAKALELNKVQFCPLQVLNLQNCVNLLPGSVIVVEFVRDSCPDLKELHVDELTDFEVNYLADICHCLRKLYLACDNIKSSSCIRRLCVGNPQLEVLELHFLAYRFSGPLNSMNCLSIGDLVTNCVALKSIRFRGGFPITHAKDVLAIIAHCPGIEAIDLFGTTVNFRKRQERRKEVKVCRILLASHLDKFFVGFCKELLSGLAIPVESFDNSRTRQKLGMDTLELLASKSGGEAQYINGIRMELVGNIGKH